MPAYARSDEPNNGSEDAENASGNKDFRSD